MELIGKQIAIETILGQPPELHYPSWYAAQIEKLPPAPPEYLAEQAGILVTDSDTISRQAAIDALYSVDEYNSRSVKAIKQLPPIQPEIVRCKDCKHRDPEDKKCDCGHDIQWQLPRQDDWYCADGER